MGCCFRSDQTELESKETKYLTLTMIKYASDFWFWHTARTLEYRDTLEILTLCFVRTDNKTIVSMLQTISNLFLAYLHDYNKHMDIIEFTQQFASKQQFKMTRHGCRQLIKAISCTFGNKYPKRYSVEVRLCFEQTLYIFSECLYQTQFFQVHKLRHYVDLTTTLNYQLEHDIFMYYMQNYHEDSVFYQRYKVCQAFLTRKTIKDKKMYLFQLCQSSSTKYDIASYISEHAADLNFDYLDQMVHFRLDELKNEIKTEWWDVFEDKIFSVFTMKSKSTFCDN